MNTPTKQHTRTQRILEVLRFFSWVVFIGAIVKIGMVLFTYIILLYDLFPPERLYIGMELSELRNYSFPHYTVVVFLALTIICLEATLAFYVIRVLTRINLKTPFTMTVARSLARISYLLLSIAVIAVVFNANSEWLMKHQNIPVEKTAFEPFLFSAGLIYIISQIFKRGVELQSENELTV